MRKVTATELQRHAREVIDQVRVRHEPVIVENRGKPMAVVISYDEYVRFSRYVARRAEDFRDLDEMVEASAAHNNLTEDEAMALARQEIRAYREDLRGKASA